MNLLQRISTFGLSFLLAAVLAMGLVVAMGNQC